MKIWDKRWESFALKVSYVHIFIVLLVNYFQALKPWWYEWKNVLRTNNIFKPEKAFRKLCLHNTSTLKVFQFNIQISCLLCYENEK